MKILLLTHSFNGLTQRLFCELREAGHAVTVELDISDEVTAEAVALARPDVIVAPFLKRRIAERVWSQHLCLVVHPGPPGDQGPAALDRAILDGVREWGVTVLQATGEFDAGPVWASRTFVMPTAATKSAVYRQAVVPAAVAAVHEALDRHARLGLAGAHAAPPGRFRPVLPQAERRIDWAADATRTVLRKIACSDGAPGVLDTLFGVPVRLFDAHAASAADLARAGDALAALAPRSAIAQRGPALLLRTHDGAVWVGHVRCEPEAGAPGVKIPATRAFAAGIAAAALPEWPVPLERDAPTWDELRYREHGPEDARVGVLSFEFHNGAMSVRQCRRLQAALAQVAMRPTRVLVLDGGAAFFSNGIHLHEIEAAQLEGASAADASMANIEAIDDVALAILSLTDRLVVAALRGNAGAGGCFLALAADEVWAHGGVVQNPHYRNMGNLHGSEYWTYLLPRRVGPQRSREIMRNRLPMGAAEAQRLGLVDAVLTADTEGFSGAVRERALALAAAPQLLPRVHAKAAARAADEAARPLAAYRADELRLMHRNFYGFDPSYHVARHHFVHRKPHAWTPRHLALHRDAPRGP